MLLFLAGMSLRKAREEPSWEVAIKIKIERQGMLITNKENEDGIKIYT